ncbi:hypothetical protein HF325_003275 [Metschnikowia pulcherrima]|uniref:3-hydroxyisobutyrate dehydrogenase n=1 Tax=Metschnikowia pulcherrima TaxID=27326 RepID=A0A8H7LC96_9ASCO|nr:hypothetical protein HF325_003275 [Metschnikowia pulcherrima]
MYTSKSLRSLLAPHTARRWLSSSTPLFADYGFIGLGQMGQYMAKHIYNSLGPLDKLYVHDVVPRAVSAFVDTVTKENPRNKNSLRSLSSTEEFVTKVDKPLDFIITMVPEGRHVKCIAEQFVDAHKKTSPLPTKTTILDSSTIDIQTSAEIHEFLTKELPGFDFIDTPVSGGVAGARKGTLSFMLSRESHQNVSPSLTKLLNMMGKNIFPCGNKHGSGLAAKLSNNYLLAVTNLAVADSFQLAKAFNLNLQQYAKLVAVSTGKSWASVDNCPIPDPMSDTKAAFITKLTKKDLVLATGCAESANRSLFLGDVSKKWYLKACEREDLANRDLGVLYEWLGELREEDGKIVDTKTSEKFTI